MSISPEASIDTSASFRRTLCGCSARRDAKRGIAAIQRALWPKNSVLYEPDASRRPSGHHQAVECAIVEPCPNFRLHVRLAPPSLTNGLGGLRMASGPPTVP